MNVLYKNPVSEKIMLQPITVRTVKSYQQDDQSDCVNVVQIEDEISATFELFIHYDTFYTFYYCRKGTYHCVLL